MKLVVLGSGASFGVPVVGCACPVCGSADSRDKRMRSSLYIEGDGGERAVIDTGPEFRLQCLRAGITRLDAVFLTHSHADHVHGLDDIRSLSFTREIPVYGNAATLEELRERFAYVFRGNQPVGRPRIRLEAVPPDPVRLGNLLIQPLPVRHGDLGILGWKISETPPGGGTVSAVYLTDTSRIPPPAMALASGPEAAVIGGLRMRSHELHFSFSQALSAGLALGARRVYLTHICHDSFHRDIEEYCRNFGAEQAAPAFLGPAYDGLEIVLQKTP